jgi:hypothetical protein
MAEAIHRVRLVLLRVRICVHAAESPPATPASAGLCMAVKLTGAILAQVPGCDFADWEFRNRGPQQI